MSSQTDSKPRNRTGGHQDTHRTRTRSYVAPQPLQGAVINLGDGQIHLRIPGSNQVCPDCYTPIGRVKARSDARCTSCRLALPINGKAKLKKKRKKEEEDDYDERDEDEE